MFSGRLFWGCFYTKFAKKLHKIGVSVEIQSCLQRAVNRLLTGLLPKVANCLLSVNRICKNFTTTIVAQSGHCLRFLPFFSRMVSLNMISEKDVLQQQKLPMVIVCDQNLQQLHKYHQSQGWKTSVEFVAK